MPISWSVCKYELWLKEEQGWSRGESTRLNIPPTNCGPGSIPGLAVLCGLSLLLLLVLPPRDFSPGTPVFPSPQKTTFPHFNSITQSISIYCLKVIRFFSCLVSAHESPATDIETQMVKKITKSF